MCLCMCLCVKTVLNLYNTHTPNTQDGTATTTTASTSASSAAASAESGWREGTLGHGYIGDIPTATRRQRAYIRTQAWRCHGALRGILQVG